MRRLVFLALVLAVAAVASPAMAIQTDWQHTEYWPTGTPGQDPEDFLTWEVQNAQVFSIEMIGDPPDCHAGVDPPECWISPEPYNFCTAQQCLGQLQQSCQTYHDLYTPPSQTDSGASCNDPASGGGEGIDPGTGDHVGWVTCECTCNGHNSPGAPEMQPRFVNGCSWKSN